MAANPVSLKFVQIKNFRSIIDSGKFHIPADGITVLVGQNESGKTSIIEALEAYENEVIDNEDRTNEKDPTIITCTFCLTKDHLQSAFSEHEKELQFLSNYFNNDVLEVTIEVLFPPGNTNGDRRVTDAYVAAYSNVLQTKLEQIKAIPIPEVEKEMLDADSLEIELVKLAPNFLFFKDDSLLPREILLSEIGNNNSKAVGVKGARNFLNVLDVNLEELKQDFTTPTRKQTLQKKLNKKFTADFNKFWTQEVIHGNQAKVFIDFANVPAGNSNAGADIFRFMVVDLEKHLYPDQRSKGFQWFLSFYLQLMVLGKEESPCILLIDEPGAHLHIKAKKDLLAVLEQVKNIAPIIYTTHEPELIDTNKLNRIRVVTPVGSKPDDYRGTKVNSIEKSATETGAKDALSPIYKAMGADFSALSDKLKRSAVLEEPSAYYYLTAWEKILGINDEIFLLPAMGAKNIPLYFNLLMGWGFNSKLILDDDAEGREAYKLIIEEWAFSEEERKTKLLKLKAGPTIEKLFETIDFQKFVLDIPEDELNPKAQVDKLLHGREGKALLAKKFLDKINGGTLGKENFDQKSITNFQEIFDFLTQ